MTLAYAMMACSHSRYMVVQSCKALPIAWIVTACWQIVAMVNVESKIMTSSPFDRVKICNMVRIVCHCVPSC